MTKEQHLSNYTYISPCHFGLEKVLSFELKSLGAQNIVASDGHVCFYGDESLLARTNICLATAERVGIIVGKFRAETFDELFSGVYKLPLEQFVGRLDAFPNKGYSLNSKLTSIPACQSIIKKAMARRLGEHYGMSILEESGEKLRFQFSIVKDEVTIVLDTSGEGLHKRGYRRNSTEAPIKETLAAGIVDLARVRENDAVCDPFCGSGTFLIESAFKAMNIAPGLSRKFAAQQYGFLPKEIWSAEKSAALERIKRDAQFIGYGFDIDNEAVKLAEQNARKAGVIARIRFEKRDIKDFSYMTRDLKVITNPPYGERLLDVEKARELYETMGKVLLPRKQNSLFIITPDEKFEGLFGMQAIKNRKLYNGMIKCRLYSYK